MVMMNPEYYMSLADEREGSLVEEIHSLRIAYKQAMTTLENALITVERLKVAGDALAATGGQHGFDEALDNWNEVRGE